jgi:hypothetical protein
MLCYFQGQEFVTPGSNDCCGKCVDSKCVHEGVLRAIGAVWKSSNGCTTFTCKRNALGRVRFAENMILKTYSPVLFIRLRCRHQQLFALKPNVQLMNSKPPTMAVAWCASP